MTQAETTRIPLLTTKIGKQYTVRHLSICAITETLTKVCFWFAGSLNLINCGCNYSETDNQSDVLVWLEVDNASIGSTAYRISAILDETVHRFKRKQRRMSNGV